MPWPERVAEGREHEVGDARGRLDVAPRDGRRAPAAWLRVEDRARRATISIGRKAPADAGMSGSVSTRTANRQAASVTASGQLRLPSCWSALPVKSSVSRSPDDDRAQAQAEIAIHRLQYILRPALAVGSAARQARVRRSA